MKDKITKTILIQDFSNPKASEEDEAILNEINKIISESNIVISSGTTRSKEKNDNSKYYVYNNGMTGNLVGIYRNKCLKVDNEEIDVTLKIGSRLDDGERAYFLATMLMKANNINMNDCDIPTGFDDIFDFLLVFQYVYALKEAYRQGVYTTYQIFHKNDAHLRGAINFAEHIKLNLAMNNGKIAYSYREKTVDNTLNHLILHTYDFILKNYPDITRNILVSDRDFKNIILQLQSMCLSYENTSLQLVVNKMLRPISHPYFSKYEDVRKICLRILQRKKISLFGQDNEYSSYGIFYYVPDLWEEYLESLLRQNKTVSILAQKEYRYYGGANDENTSYKVSAFPDFILKNDRGSIILDAKYRPGWYEKEQENGTSEIPKSWYSEDFDKCMRDMIVSGSNASGVIYPYGKNEKDTDNSNKEQNNSASHMNNHRISEDCSKYFYTIGLCVPSQRKEDDTLLEYSKWREKLDLEEKQFAKMIHDLIAYELSNKP